jgi:hypothetical protein
MKRAVGPLAVLALFAACGFPQVGYRSEGDDGGGDARGTVDGPIGVEGSGVDGASGADSATGADGAGEAGDATFSGGGEASAGSDAANDSGDSSPGIETGADAPGPGTDATPDAPSDASASDASDASDTSAADSGVDASDDVHEAAVDALPVCDEDQDTYDARGTCGGNDCCDTDAKAHPGQTTFFAQADACGSFDYNCNGQLDAQYPVNLTCGGTGLSGCSGGSAFLGDPGCGNSGLFATCVANGLLACQPGDETMVTQGCN